MTSAASVQAWKKTDDGEYLTPCDFNDSSAVKFDVKYAGAPYGMAIHFGDKLPAEDVCRALNACHEAGKLAKLAELRKFLGL